MYYKGIVGSHLFGSVTEYSDIDYLVIAKEAPYGVKGIDLFYVPPKKFMYYTFDTIIPNSDKQIHSLFSKPIIETEFSNYLVTNREELFRSNLCKYGIILLAHANRVANENYTPLMKVYPVEKRIITGLRSVNEYINYAKNNISFEEAMKQPDELIELIKNIKTHIVSPEQGLEKLKIMIEEAVKYQDFYDKKPDIITTQKIKQSMQEILEIK